MADVTKKTVDTQLRSTGAITDEDIKKLYKVFQDYSEGKQVLNQRIKSAESWYKAQHWKELRKEEDEPASAYLFNMLINKHADAMDNFPAPNVLPQEESDQETASMLSKIVPTILEKCNYEKAYSDGWWSKLKTGTSAFGVFWNPGIDNGLGDVDVKEIDMMNLYWEPGIRDLEQSKYIFVTALKDNDDLMMQYPFLEGPGTDETPQTHYESEDYVDRTNQTSVYDCYYKKQIGSRTVIHYIKFIEGHLLYASENDENCTNGFYENDEYPIKLDVMFPEKESPAGFGYLDVMKDPQMFIDKMDGIILRHAKRTSQPRWFVTDGLGLNEEEFLGDGPIVHVQGMVSDDRLRQQQLAGLDSAVYNRLAGKIDEIKETSGNTSYAQGTTSSVTAASAIAALQEASGKLSRDMIRMTYNTYSCLVRLVIERIRQFYNEPRTFRVIGDNGETTWPKFSNQMMRSQTQGGIAGVEFGERKPTYDIKVSAQKASPYSKVAQNELAKELYSAGVFNPELSDQALAMLQMMDFDGKDLVIQRVSQNGIMYQQIQQLQQTVMQLATIVDAQNGSTIAQNVAASMGRGEPNTGQMAAGSTSTNSLGDPVDTKGIVANAKEKAASRASVS